MATLTPPHIQQDGREGGGERKCLAFSITINKKSDPHPSPHPKDGRDGGGGSKDNASKVNSVSITINKRSTSHIMQHALHRK